MCEGGGEGGGGGDTEETSTPTESTTATSQASTSTSVSNDDMSAANQDADRGAAGYDPTGNTRGFGKQVSSVTRDNITTDYNPNLDAGLSKSAIDSIGQAKSQAGFGDVTGFGGQKGTGADVGDYSPTVTSLDDARDKEKKGSLFRDPKNPFTSFINKQSKIGYANTVKNFNKGYAPTYGKDGNITGTTGYGIGMGSPTGSVPSYGNFSDSSPSEVSFGNQNDIGGDENDYPEIIRRNPNDSDLEEFPIAPAPISDDLASNYLQNPYYGYSGQGNLYQPYGYAQNTLVDLLRTRNMTQPQQRAANLGLFGNPGDFS